MASFKQAIHARDSSDAAELSQDKEGGRVAAMHAHVVDDMQEGEGPGRAEQIQLAQDTCGLAESAFEQGEHEQALLHYSKARKVLIGVYGHMHMETAATYNNEAVVYEQLAQYDKALECYSKSLDIKIRVVGNDHPDVAISRFNLGLLLSKMNKTSDAKKLFGDAAAIFLQSLGPDHPHTKQALKAAAADFF
jgi:tetratricopeptide (TPR) repeat protein